jgi:hypothetical protein
VFKTTWVFLVLLLCSLRSYAAPGVPDPKLAACRETILALAEEGPGGDWIVRDRLFELMRERGLKRLIYGAVFKCPQCGLNQPHKGADGKLVTCEGCTNPFQTDHSLVHDVVDSNGNVLVHVRSIRYNDDGEKKVLEAPWVCSYCRRTVDYEVGSCPGCGNTREASNRKVVEFGPVQVIASAPEEIEGYRLNPVETPREARPQKETSSDSGSKPRFYRRWVVGGASLALGGFILWRSYQDPAPPTLPGVRQVPSTVASVYWEQTVIVRKRTETGWTTLKPFTAKGDHQSKPSLPSDVPPHYFIDTQNYQVEVIPYYSILLTRSGSVPFEQPVSQEEFPNWLPGDRVILLQSTAVEEIRRVEK